MEVHILFKLFIVAAVSYVQGDIRFVCPRPQVADSMMTQGPCGNGFARPFYEDYMEVTPGPMTLRWEETTSRKGAPMRIVLMDRDTMQASCIILDHIPHNDASKSSPTGQCITNDYPLGKCQGSLNYVTVDIPDILCERCILQLISVNTGDSQQSCYQMDIGTNNCTTYYSCANIRIIPSSVGRSKNISACGNYPAGLVDKWPYTEQIVHEAMLTPPFDETNYVRLFEKDGKLPFDIKLFSFNIIVNAESVVVVNPLNEIILRLIETEVDILHFMGVMPSLSAQDMQFLKTGQLRIRMTTIASGDLEFPISERKEQYVPGRYVDHGLNYTMNGWLSGSTFLGHRATYPQAIYPAGQCQPKDTNQYLVVLRNSTGHVNGVLAYTISGMIMSIKGLFPNLLFFLQFTTNSGTETLSLHSDLLKNRFIDGSDSVLPFLNSVAGQHPTDVTAALGTLSLVIVNGPVQRGVKALVYRGNTVIGIAVITFQDYSSFTVTAMLQNDEGLFTLNTSVTLNGPATASQSGPVLENLSTNMQFMGFDQETVVIRKRVSLKNNLYPLYLWAGYLYIDVASDSTTSPRAISGQFQRLTQAICQFMDNIACASRVQFIGTGFLPEYGPVVEPSAEAIAYLSNDNQTLEWGMILRELRPNERVNFIALEQGGNRVFSFQDISVVNAMFQTTTGEEKVLIGKGTIELTNDIKRILQEGNSELALGTAFSNQDGGVTLRGSIPSIQFTDLELPVSTPAATQPPTTTTPTPTPAPTTTTITTTPMPTPTTTTTPMPTPAPTTTTTSPMPTPTSTTTTTTPMPTPAPATTTTSPMPTPTSTTTTTTPMSTPAPTTTTTSPMPTPAPTTTTTPIPTPPSTTTTTTPMPTPVPITTTTTTIPMPTPTTTTTTTTPMRAPGPTTTPMPTPAPTTTMMPTSAPTTATTTTTTPMPTLAPTTPVTARAPVTATTPKPVPSPTTTAAVPRQTTPFVSVEETPTSPPRPNTMDRSTGTTPDIVSPDSGTPTTTTTTPPPLVQPDTTPTSRAIPATDSGLGGVATDGGIKTTPAFRCKSTGIFEDPYDCYYFHMCVSYGYLNKMIDYKMPCPERLVFDGRLDQCQWKYLVPRKCE